LHDAVTIEKAGRPAAAIMTDQFIATARAMARSLGMPDYPFAVIPHPISNDGPTALRVKAADALRQCRVILVDRRQPEL
jgi:hypothetical protein